jgi:hypothetical protein
MTTDKSESRNGPSWLTLTEAAARTGYSRDALRQRVRRGKLRFIKGNDDMLRVDALQLADLPPSNTPEATPGPATDVSRDNMLAYIADMIQENTELLKETRVDLETARDRLRSDLDRAQFDRLDDRGRAERAEARAEAEARRANAAERRLEAAEAALAEARTPWTVRVLRALRGG